jgi:hypothetical protein
LTGICDIFDRYHEFITAYENVIRNKNYAKANGLFEYSTFLEEMREGEKLKRKFEEYFKQEINLFGEDFNDTMNIILKDFQDLILKCNTDVDKILI